MRKFIVAIILLIGIMLILTQFAEIEDISNTLRRGDWRYLVLGFVIELIWIVNIGVSFKAIYRMIGVEEKLARLILLAASANFLNVVAPAVGIGGIAIFISDARNRGYSPGRATVASALFVLFDYLGFLSILTLGFVVLIRRDQVDPPEITASIILVFIALSLSALLYLGAYSQEKLEGVMAGLAKLVNLVTRPFRSRKRGDIVSIERARIFAGEIAGGINTMRKQPRDLVYPLLLAITSKVLMIVVMFFVFLAFNVPVSIGTLIASYCMAFLFLIVSPTPSGVGIVEGVLTLTLHSFYIPMGTAAVISLVYRGFTFWLPLFIGMLAFRWVGTHSGNQNSGGE